jgi:hypothetical protein
LHDFRGGLEQRDWNGSLRQGEGDNGISQRAIVFAGAATEWVDNEFLSLTT